jgi:hypothetical protein
VRPGQRHRPADEGRVGRRVAVCVHERRRQPLFLQHFEAGARQIGGQRALLAELEEQRADIAHHFGIDDGEHGRPAAARAFAPHGQRDPAARAQHTPHLAQAGHGVGQVHQAQGAQHQVEAGVGQVEPLGIHAREAGFARPCALRPGRGGIHHGLRNVDADDPARGAHGSGRHAAGHARAAGHVEHLFTRRRRRHGQHGGLRRRELFAPQRIEMRRGQVPAVALHAALQSGVHGLV